MEGCTIVLCVVILMMAVLWLAVMAVMNGFMGECEEFKIAWNIRVVIKGQGPGISSGYHECALWLLLQDEER